MTIAPGTRLGAYEILSLLGVGSMGEVYRARDETLGREVAIKVLPASVANDRDRLLRFEREAHVLATLNHPHIGGIYGIEEPEACAVWFWSWSRARRWRKSSHSVLLKAPGRHEPARRAQVRRGKPWGWGPTAYQ